MPGDFWRNIDWDKFHSMAFERAKKDLDDKPNKYPITSASLDNIEQFEEEIKAELRENYLFLLARTKHHMDYIWLMGPVPMKEGYEPPTFEATWLL